MGDSKRFVKYGDSIVKGLAQGSKNATKYTLTFELDKEEIRTFTENFVKEEFGVSLEELESLRKQWEEKQKRLNKGTH